MSHHRLIIVGSGPAGYTAAIYASRANIELIMFEGFQKGGMPGGQLMITNEVENYPGFAEGIMGPELMSRMKAQAERFGSKLIMEDIESVDFSKRPFSLTSMNGETFTADAVIISTGATAKRLDMESEQRLWNKGISACAVCDGALPLFRNKPLAVIGGGDSAVEEAVHLTQFGSQVYLIHRRDELRASKIMQKRALEHPKIEILWNKTIAEFCGSDTLSSLQLKDTQTGDISSLEVAGAFEAIGHIPNTAFLQGQLKTDDTGYILTKPGTTETSIEGVFAAGDVQDRIYRQAVTAAGSGCMAALQAERWLAEQE